MIKKSLLNCTTVKKRRDIFKKAYNIAQIEYGKMDEYSIEIVKEYINGFSELENIIKKELDYIKMKYNTNREEDFPLNDNKLGITNVGKMKMACSSIVTFRLMELFFEEDSVVEIGYNFYKYIHEYIFKDIYPWAGEERTIALEKRLEYLNGRTVFFLDDEIDVNMKSVFKEINSLTENTIIDKTMKGIFEKLSRDDWEEIDSEVQCAICARIIGKLWFIHPFIEGNTVMALFIINKVAEMNHFPFSTKILREQHEKYDLRKCILLASLPENYDINFLASILLLARKVKEMEYLDNKKKNITRRNLEDFLAIADVDQEDDCV